MEAQTGGGMGQLAERQRRGTAELAFLLWQMTRAAFLAEEKNSVLGLLWHFLNPLAMTAVLYVTFSSIGRPHAIDHYPLFILVGVIHFNFFANATSRAAEGMRQSRSFVLNTTVPLQILVLRQVCIEGLTLAIELVLVCLLISIAGVGLSVAALGYGVVVVGLFMLTFGTALLLSTAVVFITDVTYVWNMATRMLFFLTPIFYSPQGITSAPLRMVTAFNPLATAITLARETLLYGRVAALWHTVAVVVAPLGVLILGWRVFHRFKGRIPDYI
jgi:ABC-type polysaccharide/polyol phosphate export permease